MEKQHIALCPPCTNSVKNSHILYTHLSALITIIFKVVFILTVFLFINQVFLKLLITVCLKKGLIFFTFDVFMCMSSISLKNTEFYLKLFIELEFEWWWFKCWWSINLDKTIWSYGVFGSWVQCARNLNRKIFGLKLFNLI